MTRMWNRPARSVFAALCALLLLLAGCAGVSPPHDMAQLREQVRATEIAFARTMTQRDHAAFMSFLSEETVFFTGPTPKRGKREVAEAWARFYKEPLAPFSWAPDEVEVLPSGNLALTSGPVHDPSGKLIGRFTSIWRLEAPGQWRVIFDKGCNCPLK